MTETVAVAAAPPRTHAGGSGPGRVAGRARASRRKTLTAYLFLAPFLLLFGSFIVAPGIFGVWMSLTNWSPFREVQDFVGLQNYIDLFTPGTVTSADFWKSMSVTGTFVLVSVPFLVVFPLIVAILLNQRIRMATTFRTIFFAPYVLGVAVIGVIWGYILDTQSGIMNHLLGLVGLPSNLPWTVDVPWVWVSLVGVTIWWTMGLNTIIFLAGLKGINADLYEAAAIDGAGSFGKFANVTIPGLRPVMTFITTTTILASANMFGQSYLLTKGGPGTETRTVIMYIADQGLSQNNMAPAAAMSYVLFAALAIISVLNFRLQRERVEKGVK